MSLRGWASNRLSGGDFNAQLAVLKEAVDWYAERAKEDSSWKNLLADAGKTYAVWNREALISIARRFFNGNDPFVKRGVWAHTEFCFGNGAAVRNNRQRFK